MTKYVAILWFVLALTTLYLIIFSDAPSLIVALVAWTGGLVTGQMLSRIVKDADRRNSI